MQKNTQNKIKILISIVFITFLSIYPAFQKSKALLSSISDTLSRAQNSVDSNHTIVFTTATGLTGASDTIIITFPSDFDATDVVYTDIDLSATTIGDIPLLGTAGATAYGASFIGRVLTLTHATDEAYKDIPALAVVTIKIGTHTAGPGVNMIKNATTNGSKLVTIAGTGSFTDTGSYALAIIADDSVTVNASVDPSITFTINGGGVVTLGALTTSAVSVQNHTIATTTNAVTGYTTRMYENNDLRSTATPGDTINDVGDGVVTIGQEEYGMSTSDAGNDILQEVGGGDEEGSAITTSQQSVATAGGAVTADTTTIYYKAAISGLTVAHSDYTHEVTFVSTGNF